MRLRKDPGLRRDGVCALKGCEKQLPKVGRENNDSFCSTRCCRLWHGLPDPNITYQAKVAAA